MKREIIEEELKVLPKTPALLALQLHASEKHGLEISLPEDWVGAKEEEGQGYSISEGRLTFKSLADRNQILAQHFCDRYLIKGKIDREQLFSIAYGLWSYEIGQKDFASGRFLVKASKLEDILHLAAKHIEAGFNCFDVLHVISAMLPHADEIVVRSLIELVHAQHEGTKGDLMRGLLYSSLDKWLGSRPQVAREIWNCLENEGGEVTASLLGTSLVGLSRSSPSEAVGLAINTANSLDGFRKRIGHWFCGSLLQQPNISDADRASLEQVMLNGIGSKETEIRSESIRAAANALLQSPSFDQILFQLAQEENQDALFGIGNALFRDAGEFRKQERFYKWLPALVALTPPMMKSVDGLDVVLSQVFQSDIEGRPIIVDFLTSWTARHSGPSPSERYFTEAFDSCMYKLSEHPDWLASVLTDWLTSDDRRLAGAAAGMLTELEIHKFSDFRLDSRKVSAMSPGELMFLARRILGFSHSPQTLLSLSLSMLSVDSEALSRVLPLLRSVIVDEIGYDYPGTTIDALKEAIKSEVRPEVASAIDSWRTIIESIQNELNHLPGLSELRPPARLQRQFALARSKQMAKAQKEASKNSVFSLIANEVHLKAGRSWFNHTHGQYGEPSSLKSYSYSFEMPRREVLDPVGNAIRGLHLRLATKNSE